MKITFKPLGLLTSSFVAVPMLAHAAANGPYIGIEGGGNWEMSQNIKSDDLSTIGNFDYKSGWVGGVTAGYSGVYGFRPELQIDYRRNDVNKLSVGSAAISGGGTTGAISTYDVAGFQNTYTAMGNLWYDVKLPDGLFNRIHPYAGGGIGAARVDFRNVELHYQNDFVTATSDLVNDFSTKLAYQGGAGIAIDLTPNLTASVDYRYLQTARGSYNIAGTDGQANVNARYRAQSGMLTLRYAFGQPSGSM